MSVFKTVCAIAVYFPQTVPDSVNHYISASYREETFLFIFIFPNRQDVTVAITALLSNCTALYISTFYISVLKVCDYSSLISSILEGIAQGITQQIF